MLKQVLLGVMLLAFLVAVPSLAQESPLLNQQVFLKALNARIETLDVSNFDQFKRDFPSFSSMKVEDIQTLKSADQDERMKLLVPAPSVTPSQVDPPTGTSNCFDDYKFGSVQVDLSPAMSQTLPGLVMPFIGKLKNDNPYPLINGSVYVKIFKKEGDDSLVHQNGYPMVDFFEAGRDIVISAKSERAFAFNWEVPANLAGGDYEADFFFVTDQRFNLLGLTFTDDVTGNKSMFHITSDRNEQVVFDKNAVTLNGNQYRFAAFPPHFTKDETVKTEVKLINPSNEQKVVAIVWQLFNWDGLREENRLDERRELITLKPKETKTLSYDATKYTGSVSYLLIEARDGDASSKMNVRFVRDDVLEMRLNFPSVTSFPVTEGKEMSIFSCVHSTNAPQIDGNEIVLSLTDADTHETIHSFTYKGVITGAMMGVRESFTPKKTFGKVNLTTTLKHDSQMIDTVTQTYDCADIDPSMCPKAGSNEQGTASKEKNRALWYGLIAIVSIVGLFTVIWREVKKRKSVNG